VCRSPSELKERLYSFALQCEDVDKQQLLRTVCCQVAGVVCRTDGESLLTTLDPKHLLIETSDVNTSTLTRAVRLASKTTRKVGRAFSFSKTPSKLKRAVSTMISPFHGAPSGAFSQDTRVMCTSVLNLNEEDSDSPPECPPSPTPSVTSYADRGAGGSGFRDRKVKSLGPSTTRRM